MLRNTNAISIRHAIVSVSLALALVGVALPAMAAQVKLDVAMGSSLALANEKQTAYLRVGMTGPEMEEAARPPVNVAIVLDKSGSMTGQKIAKAKEGAIAAIQRLRAEDIVSVVVYDSTVRVVVPATKVSDREAIYAAIRQIEAGGNTALFAGVSKGAQEIRKFLDPGRVNRVVLLSDGLANVGPSSPGALADLGTSLVREGISVTTIGLGLDYNEDLMASLAKESDGNHLFAENADDLRGVFASEFGDVLSVAAKNVGVTIHCAEGVRPVRTLGRNADIVKRTVTANLNQLYSGQTKYVLVELELPPGEIGGKRPVASVDVSYANMDTKERERLREAVSVAYTDSPDLVEKRADRHVMADVIHQIAVEQNVLAMRLRDEGKIEDARRILTANGAFLFENADKYDSQVLRHYSTSNTVAVDNLDEGTWRKQRKEMREEQYQIKQQQMAN